jgi:hypothetical protein
MITIRVIAGQHVRRCHLAARIATFRVLCPGDESSSCNHAEYLTLLVLWSPSKERHYAR